MDIKTVAQNLLAAERQVQPVAPLTVTYPDITMEDAYNIQQAGVTLRREESGCCVVGKKIGLTSLAMQKLLGVNEPDYGHLLDHMLLTPGQPMARSELLLPKVEGEIAFVLNRTLKGPGVTFTDVLRATEGVMAAIEIVDSRVKDWKITLADTVSDNASSARFVLGSRMVPVDRVDLRLVGMVLEKNGDVLSTGAGAAVWGHPAASVAWLANKLATFGIALEAGEIILSGALTAAVDARQGDYFHVAFQELGSVGVRFI